MKRLGFVLLFILLALSLPVRSQAQTNPCGTGVPHCSVLAWVASPTSGVTYNVYRGTTSGGESLVPLNSAPITGTSYIDPITLTTSPQTFYYYIEAVEVSSGITVYSIPGNEASGTFPGTPAPPTALVVTPH